MLIFWPKIWGKLLKCIVNMYELVITAKCCESEVTALGVGGHPAICQKDTVLAQYVNADSGSHESIMWFDGGTYEEGALIRENMVL